MLTTNERSAPKLSQRIVDRALAKDRVKNTAEYLAEFRNDVSGYVDYDVVQSCVGDYVEMGYVSEHQYSAFVDPAGGSGKDSFTAAVGHQEEMRVVIDAVREYKPPFSPEAVISEICPWLKTYNISRVVGDRFGGEFPREKFRRLLVDYDCSKSPKSDLFRDFLPMMNSNGVTFPRSDRLVNQICSLERRTARSGKDSIGHPERDGFHDDLANAVAGCAVMLVGESTAYDESLLWVCGPDDEKPNAGLTIFNRHYF